MTLVDKTTPAQTATISLEFDLPHAPEKVWRALTDPELLAEWLLPTVSWKLEKGHAFTFQTNPMPGWDGTVHCRVLDVETHTKISYAWVVGELDTVVTFTLTPTTTGTQLSIVQSGFKPTQKQNFAGARYGFKMMGEKLIALLAAQP